MFSVPVLAVLVELVSQVTLEATDPQLVEKAAMLVQVRTELAAAIQDASATIEAANDTAEQVS